MKKTMSDRWIALTERLDGVGAWLAPLGLRLILAWEFWEAGVSKYQGDNWFMHIQANFPFPFNYVPANISWAMATWAEILFSLALLFGLFTRFAAFSLLVLTFVAIAAVHWPDSWASLGELWKGYAISDDGFGNFKLPLLFIVMLIPLIFTGAGKLSLDHALSKASQIKAGPAHADMQAWGIGLMAIGGPLAFVMPVTGAAIALFGLLILVVGGLNAR